MQGIDQNNRVRSVDIGRGFAIFCMIAAHISVTFWVINGYGAMLAAPFFLLISGISFEFFMESRIRKKKSTQTILLESFSRSVFIYALPLVPYIVVCLLYPSKFPFQLIHWGVFQVIAVGYIIGIFLHQNWKLKVAAIFSVFILMRVIQIFFHPILGFLLSDFTPVLPWLAYFVMGQLVYEIYQKQTLPASILLLVSCITLILGILIFIFSNLPFEYNFRAQIPVFLLLSSIFFFIQSIFIILVDRLHKCEFLLNPLERIGKIAFTSYYLQFPLIFGVVFIITKGNLPSTIVIPSIFIIIAFLAILEKYWEKYDFLFGFEWIIRKGSTLLNEWIISNYRRMA